jgi:hypothetical protein
MEYSVLCNEDGRYGVRSTCAHWLQGTRTAINVSSPLPANEEEGQEKMIDHPACLVECTADLKGES